MKRITPEERRQRIRDSYPRKPKAEPVKNYKDILRENIHREEYREMSVYQDSLVKQLLS